MWKQNVWERVAPSPGWAEEQPGGGGAAFLPSCGSRVSSQSLALAAWLSSASVSDPSPLPPPTAIMAPE